MIRIYVRKRNVIRHYLFQKPIEIQFLKFLIEVTQSN